MKKLVLALLVLLLAEVPVYAVGALYARRAQTNTTGTPLWLKKYDADVTITDQMAVTHVDHTFKNETSSRLEGVFIFPLPEGAVVTELALWINGVRVVGDVMERDTARAVYESIVRKTIDPALLEYMGDNVFKLSVFPIEPNGKEMSERRIEITYAELLPYEDGSVDYGFYMKTANLSAKPVERASIKGTITTQKPIISLSSTTHKSGTQLALSREDDRNYSFVYGNENAHSETDLVIEYQFEDETFALNHLVYNPGTGEDMFFDAEGDDGYFLLWVTPPHNPATETVLAKNVAIVADVSSSMSGTRIVQLRKALGAMVDMLSEKDRFSILAFSSGVQKFHDDMVKATEENLLDAHEFIDALSEAGLTNYEGALNEAFDCTWSDDAANVIVFFTDGKPTWPVETSDTRILALLEELNTDDISVYPFGVGEEPDAAILKRMAAENSGAYFAIPGDAAIEPVLSGFMRRISYPLLKNITMEYDGISPYDVYPRTLPSLFAGTQLSVLGRFRTKTTSEVLFTGEKESETVTVTEQLKFDATQENQPFVPRMWASSKIDYLLGEIAVAGEQQELVDNVKTLGKKYSIITPYTSMLVIEPNTKVAEDKIAVKPTAYSFTAQMEPNGAAVMLRYAIPGASPQRIRIRVFDASGKLVRKLVDDVVGGGNFLTRWDFRTESGIRLPSGFYFAMLETGEYRQLVKLQLVR
ncbi:MAG: VWA domain-containing protein [Chitinispirillaceae bacterium]|nr:VWA domain-containing protein [Chitinispirillaceae bacterium]